MAQACDCSAVVFGNTGDPNCKKIQDIARHLGLTFTKNTVGQTKEYTIEDEIVPFLSGGMKSFIESEEPADRIYWLKEFENVTNLREDSVFQTFNSGRQAKVRDGFKNFTGMLVNAPYELLGEIRNLICKDLSALIMDKSDNIIGYRGADSTVIRPIKINTASFDAKYVEPTDTEAGGIMIQFQWSLSQSDENLVMVKCNELEYTSDDLYGLRTVNHAYSNITTSTVTVTLTSVYDEAVTNLELADFALSEKSPTPAPITITSVTETSAGVYDIVFPAESSGDVLALKITKDFYDFALVNNADITIP